jgi:hypothetical protein
MKKIFAIIVALLPFCLKAQTTYVNARDEGNERQLERMVFVRWDEWEPWSLYWSLLHDDYKDEDKRILTPSGPYVAHQAFLLAQEQEDEKYKMYTDTIAQKHKAIDSSWGSGIPDLPWWLHFKKAFEDLEDEYSDIVNSQSADVQNFLQTHKMLVWYENESGILVDRLSTLKNAYMDRGSRVMAYQRIYDQYENLNERFKKIVVVAKQHSKFPVFKPTDPHDQEGPFLRAVHKSIDGISSKAILGEHFKKGK